MSSLSIQPSAKINLFPLSHRNILVACTIKKVKTFLNAIRSLGYTNNTDMEFSETGLRFTSEESHFFQGTAFFTKEYFEKYYYSSKLRNSDEAVRFGVNLTAVADFFGAIISNDSATLKITYYGEDRPIAFIFSQNDNMPDKNKVHNDLTYQGNAHDDEELGEIITEYIIKIKDSINPIDFSTKNFQILSSVELNASDLAEIIHDLDKMTEEISIKITENSFVFKAGVNLCRTQISYSTDHKIFRNFVYNESSKFSYKFLCFRSLLKALALCSLAFIETKDNGLLKLSLTSKSFDEDSSFFYEFFIMPSVEDNDEMEEDE